MQRIGNCILFYSRRFPTSLLTMEKSKFFMLASDNRWVAPGKAPKLIFKKMIWNFITTLCLKKLASKFSFQNLDLFCAFEHFVKYQISNAYVLETVLCVIGFVCNSSLFSPCASIDFMDWYHVRRPTLSFQLKVEIIWFVNGRKTQVPMLCQWGNSLYLCITGVL